MSNFAERYRQANMPTTNHDQLAKSDEEAVEEGNLPGSTVARVKFADMSNQDENATEVTAPTGLGHTDPTKEPGEARAETSAPNPGSLAKLVGVIGHVHTAHCGFPDCPDAEGHVDYTEVDGEFIPKKNISHFTLVASDLAEDPEVNEENIIKEAPRETVLASVDDYLNLFNKTASDSELYYRGYMDGLDGKPLDEDLALLSDDYFHGYDQAKFYKQPPQVSAEQKLFDIKSNSNNLPRREYSEEHGTGTPEVHGDILRGDRQDTGPYDLTDGKDRVTAGIGLPLDILEKFLEY